MKDRAFGVELEFGTGRDYGVEYVWDELNRIGVKTDNYYDDEDFVASGAENYWTVHDDGTQVEVGSPILRGKEGFEELRYVMNHFKKEGCYTTESDGMHIHHDAPDYSENREDLIRLVESWTENREAIYRMVNPSRWGKWACPGWSTQSFNRLTEGAELTAFGRNDLNVRALRKYGTIEFRLHEGTLEYETAEAWIKFGQMFLNSVKFRRFNIPKDENSTMLLRRVKMPRTQAKILEKKAEAVRNMDLSYLEDYGY